MRLIILVLGLLTGLFAEAAERPVVTYLDSPRQFRGAQAFKDKESGITFYVESDGRHVAAINAEGKILWHRDPFVEAKLEPYRFERPVIVWIGQPHAWMTEGRKEKFISISFNSSQFGILDLKTGNFTFLGND